ncbi:hypothetical protein K492DRAFT_200220 [Lichtheimia hyalospora FSU 10163]|nr:hypothetical protein K492DRAFT_200220 [Lichtheimia hyalospora FSU 10163]
METHVDNRVDSISELPFDLVISNILSRIFGRGLTVISLHKRCSYLDVCSNWTERLAALSDDIICFSIGQRTLNDRAYRRLSALAPYIRSLHIGALTYRSASKLIAGCDHFPLLTKMPETKKELMIPQCNTLETCILEGEGPFNSTRGINVNINQDLEFKQLKSLTHRSTHRSGCSPSIDWVIKNSPNLDTIDHYKGSVTGSSLRTLMHRPLRRIQLECLPLSQQYEYEFIQDHVKLDITSHLQELECHIRGFTENSHWIY